MARQVVVDGAWCDGSRPDKRERRERLRVVERGDLGDHPADPDPRQVRRPVVKPASQCRGIGCEITQCVSRSRGIDGGRRTAVAEVVPHDVTPAAGECLAQCVGPGEHGRSAHEQDERCRRITDVPDAERDAVRFHSRQEAFGSCGGCRG